jgi:hemoglobin/transferrin/lactoferrin receptor protein
MISTQKLLATLVWGCWASVALCANQDSTTVKDTLPTRYARPIVISASRWEEGQETVSRQITRLTSRDVAIRNPGTAADLLEGSGEVAMQRSQAGGGSPRIRGFAANSVLMVVDGIRINNAIYRSGNLQNLIQIDANSLESAEVLFGPGSVQYGSDALGGVMVFRTKEPVFNQDGFDAHAFTLTRYASAASELTGNLELYLSGERLASYTSITATRFDDLRSGAVFPTASPTFGRRDWYVERINGRDSMISNPHPQIQRFSGYDQLNAQQKLRLKVDDAWTAELNAIFTTSSDIPRYDRLYELRTRSDGTMQPRQSEWYYGPQRWVLSSVSVKGENLAGIVNDVVIAPSFQWYEESRHSRRFRSDVRNDQFERVWIAGLNIDARTRLDSSAYDRDVYYGLELSHQDVASRATDVNIVTDESVRGITRYPDGGSTYGTYAAYGQMRWQLSEAITVSGGLRATIISLRSSISDSSLFQLPVRTISTNPSAVTGSIGAVWRVHEMVSISANVATGFRAPNIDDAGKVFDSQPGNVVVPNPGLGPVQVATYEAGLAVFPLPNWQIDVRAFTSHASNLIVQRPFTLNGLDSIDYNGTPSAVTAMQNVGQASVRGVSFTLDGSIETVNFRATATIVDGRDITNDLPLQHVTPAFGMLHVGWRPMDGLLIQAETRWSAAWTMANISPVEAVLNVNYPAGGLVPWTIASVRFMWDVVPFLTLSAGIENMFDLQYRPAQSGISAPGRNVILAARTRL